MGRVSEIYNYFMFRSLLGLFFIVSGQLIAQTTFTAKATAAWAAAGSWTKSGGTSTSTYPGQNAGQDDVAIIPSGFTITMGASQNNNSITSVTVNGTGVLAIKANTLVINGAAGNLTGSGSVTMTTGIVTAGGSVNVSTLNCGANAATINLSGNWGVTTFTGTASSVFLNGSTQSISATTFDNLTISTATAITLTGAITVAGNWTNNAASTMSGPFAVTFSGAGKTIGGTNGTAFSDGIVIASGATPALTTALTFSATNLTFSTGAAAATLTHNGTATLNISGTVTLNQPTGAVTNSWNVNGGTATCGTLTYSGIAAGAKINKVAVTTGSLTITTIDFAANATNADQVLSCTTGSITISSAFTFANGTITLGGAGTINFDGMVAHTGGIITNTVAGTYNFAGGYNLSTGTFTTLAGESIKFGGDFTNSFAGGTIFSATSTVIITGASTITPSSAITFGNFQINTAVTVTLAGAITVAGNWTNNAASTMSGPFAVTFSGAGKTIGGTNGTTFSDGIVIASGATPALATALTFSATTLTFNSGATAGTLTHNGTATLSISGTVTLTQPTAAVTNSWNVNGGTATCGTLTYSGIATGAFVNKVAVTTGSLTITNISFAANTTNADQVLSCTTGSVTITNAFTFANGTITLGGAGAINFDGLVTHTGGIITNTVAGTYNFAGGYNLSAGTFTTLAGETIEFGGNFTNSFAGGTTFSATSTVIITGALTITPATAIAFGNFQINSAVTVTLAGAITVAGNWTNNAASTMSGPFAVTFSGVGKTIGGTNGTTFSDGMVIASGATPALTTALTFSATTLTFNSGATAGTLTHNGTATLSISGTVTLTQPTAAVTNSWNVNGGTATCGTLTYSGVATGAFVNKVAVTTGSLTITNISFAANTTNADQVLSCTTGSITISSAFTFANGTITLGGAGAINFDGLVTHTGGVITNTVAGTYNFAGGYNLSAGTFTTLAGETIEFGGNFTNSFAGGTTFSATSTVIITGALTITPATAITFGNFQINAAVTVTLAGAIKVAGNWTNNAASTMSGPFAVTFSGVGKTIGGTNGTAFSNGISIASGATPALATALTFSATTLTFNSGATAATLTHNGTATLNISGTVTLTQPTGAVTNSWNVNGGTATCLTLTYSGIAAGAKINQVAVTSGSLTITNISFAANATNADQVLSCTTGSVTITNAFTFANGTITLGGAGTITFNALVTHTGGVITNTVAGTYDFAAGYNLSTGILTTLAGETIEFGGNFTNSFAGGTTFSASSTVIITGASTITPSTPITFGNFQINAAITVTLAGAITVAGNWTNNAASTMSGPFAVTFSGAGKIIGGTNGTAFSNGINIASGATPALATALTFSASTLTFNSGAAAATLTHNGTATLNISGTVTLTQPTATVTNSWNVNGGTASCLTLIYSGTNVASNVNQVAVTSGSLTVTSLNFALNPTNADQVLSCGSGSITITNPFNVQVGTISLNGAGKITFDGLITHSGGVIQNTITAGTFNFAGGYNLSTGTWTTLAAETIEFGGDFSNSFTGGTVFPATSTAIFTGTSTITPTTPVTFGNFQINPGVSVTPSGTISVAGNWSNNSGIFVEGTNLVQFNGSSTQSIGGTSATTFYNMNASGFAHTVQLTNSASLINQIDVTNNATFSTNNQVFTLLSTQTLNWNTFTGGGTAQVGDLSAGTFTGNVNYQRFIDGKTDWRTIAWPVTLPSGNSQTIGSWKSQLYTSGFTGATGNAGSFVSIYSYDAATGTYVAATDSSNPISAYGTGSLNGSGLFVFVGNTTPGTTMTAGVTLLSTGSIISGSQTAPVTSNVSGTYNLLANPYPAPLLFSSFYSANSSTITDFYSVYDESQGNYDTWDGSLGHSSGGRTSGTIANGQAFFVQATAGSTASFQESQKATTADGNFLRLNSGSSYQYLNLNITGSSTPYYGSMIVAFSTQCSNGYQVQEDALATAPFEPTAPTVSSYSADNYNLVINKMSALKQNFIIPVKTTVGISGTYTLTAPDLSHIEGSCIILEDKLTGTFTDLNTTHSYTFTINDTTKFPRFALHISVPMNVSTSSVNPACSNIKNGELIANPTGTGPWTYTWTDTTGKVLQTEIRNGADTLGQLTAGTYVVNVSSSGGCANQFQQSLTLNNPPQPIASFSVVNTIATVGDSILFTNNSSNANIYNWSFGDGYSSGQFSPKHAYHTIGTDTVLLSVLSGNCGGDAMQLIMTVLPSTGIQTINGKSFISIIPLSDRLQINLDFPSPTDGKIEVYDMLGQSVSTTTFSASQKSIQIYLGNNLSRGTYLVKVETLNEVAVRKIVVR